MSRKRKVKSLAACRKTVSPLERRQQRLAELAERNWLTQSVRFSPNAANSDFTATNIHVTCTVRNLPYKPQPVASMFCCRAGASQYCECAGSRCALHVRGATLDAIKAGLANLKAVPGRRSPSNWQKTSCCSTTPTTPMRFNDCSSPGTG